MIINNIRLFLAFFMIALAALVSKAWFDIQESRQHETGYITDELVLGIGNRLRGHEDYLQLLAQMRIRNEVSPETFEERTQDYLTEHPELINFTWVDQDSYIQGVAPLEGNAQILGLHLDLPEPARVSALAKETRQAQYTSSFEALQGDCSFEVWVPVYRDNQFLGFFAGVFSCQRVLDAVTSPAVLERFSIMFTNQLGANFAQHLSPQRSLSDIQKSKLLPINNGMQLLVKRYREGFWDINLLVLLVTVLSLGMIILISVFSMQREVKRRAVLQGNLERANDELQQFAYRTSHDLKSPLTTIRSLSRFMQKDLQAGDYAEVDENCKKIDHLAGKLEGLVVDILNLTRSDLHESEREEIDFRRLLDEVRHSWQPLIDSKEIRLNAKIDVRNPYMAEKVRIQQILDNLISNSIKYCHQDGAGRLLDVSVVDHDHCISIEVKDNGIGIPEEYKDRLFTMFQRFHPSVSSGSGLGMYLVKKHVDQLQGKISVPYMNNGTCIKVELPRI